jgi:hypothetical protein
MRTLDKKIFSREDFRILLGLAGFAVYFVIYLAGIAFIVYEFLNHREIRYEAVGAGIAARWAHKEIRKRKK